MGKATRCKGCTPSPEKGCARLTTAGLFTEESCILNLLKPKPFWGFLLGTPNSRRHPKEFPAHGTNASLLHVCCLFPTHWVGRAEGSASQGQRAQAGLWEPMPTPELRRLTCSSGEPSQVAMEGRRHHKTQYNATLTG